MTPDDAPGLKTNLIAWHKPLRGLSYFWHPSHVYDWGTAFWTNSQQSRQQPFSDKQGRVYQGENSEVELQLQIGSKVVPVLPSRSLAEQFYQLRKAIMGENHTNTQFNIKDTEYRTYKNIHCFDLQKISGAFASGLSTRTGNLITIKVLNMVNNDYTNQRWTDTYGDLLHATFHHDLVMSIPDAGVTILE